MNKKLLTIIGMIIVLYIVIYVRIYNQNIFTNFKNFLTNSGVSTVNDKIRTVVVNEEDATINLVKVASPAVVSVIRKDTYYDYRNGPIEQEDSIGTGFIIDGTKGIVLTNKHVVDDEESNYSVLLSEGEKKYEVAQIARDPLHDFSILQLKLIEGEVLPQLELGDSDGLQIGQTVVAIGNALGEFGNSVTKGIVSGLNRGIFASSGLFGSPEYIEDVIQTDAALNPGNSGGPLLNLQAQVVGINVAISGGAENIGFSIPINTIKPALEQFSQRGKISRPFLGVQYNVITPDIAELRNIPEGVYVEAVVENSPAAAAGIKPSDIITAIDGTPLNEDMTLAKIISKKSIGERINISVTRGEEKIELKAILKDADEQ
jgi:serine protease Do